MTKPSKPDNPAVREPAATFDADSIHGHKVYKKPSLILPFVLVAAAGALLAAAISALTYHNQNTATSTQVLGNRAVTQQLADRFNAQAVDEKAHRERNEDAHACENWGIARILHDLGDDAAAAEIRPSEPHPCAKYPNAGVVPPLPTTTTATTSPRHRTTTTGRPRTRRSTATTATTAPPSTKPTTATTACTVMVQGTCAR